jgi:RNA polymerase sigma factor (sigma-70 family)
VIVQSLQEGHLREPERLTGFVRTIVRRQIVGYINANITQRKDQVDFDAGIPAPDTSSTPEQTIVGRQQRDLIRRVLDRMNERDRQILTRFYLFEQPVEEICSDMGLSETQFRLLKSRAKARFGELGKKKLSQQALSSLFVRASASVLH